MAVVIQEICGTEDDGYYFPTLSGVARSLNFYPIGDERPEDGIANIALGLGKLVVEGESRSVSRRPTRNTCCNSRPRS